MNVQFEHSFAFWSLIAVPVLAALYGLYLLWRRKTAKALGDPRLVASLTGNHSPKKAALKNALFLLAFALTCLALANPRRPDDASAEVRKGIDVVIALDVSNSMLATDVSPSRLAVAQRFLNTLVDGMPNDRIGFVVFAGNAYTQMPLSTDHEAAKLFISTASPGTVPEQGTSIADALLQSDAAFEEGSGRFKTVILVTDGETHDEDALSVAGQLAKKGVLVNTVGLGSAEGTTIIDTTTGTAKLDESGARVVSKLNEELLRRVAEATNGDYFHLQQVGPVMAGLLEQYKNVEKKALVDTGSLTYETFYWWVLLPAFLLLLAEVFIPDRKKQIL